MSGYTQYYNLKKPSQTENYDIDVANMNNDIIDNTLYSKVDKKHGKDLSTNDFTDGYKKKIDSMQTLYRFKGTVNTVNDLSVIENRNIGDVYKCKEDINNYVWNGQEWINIGQDADFNAVMEQLEQTKQELQQAIKEGDTNTICDMSRNYTDTNITADTVEGYGTCHSVSGVDGKVIAGDVNLFNVDSHVEFRDGYRSATNGAKLSNASFWGLKIPVQANKTYVTSADIAYTEISNLCFFDSGMKFISGNAYNTVNRMFTTPSSCVYVTFAINKNFKKFKLQEGEIANPYSRYGYGTVEVISKNGEQQDSLIIETEPLYENNYIDLAKNAMLPAEIEDVYDENCDWTYDAGYKRFYCSKKSNMLATAPYRSNQYVQGNTEQTDKRFNLGTTQLFVKDMEYTTIEMWKEHLKSNPIVVTGKWFLGNGEVNSTNKIKQFDGQTTFYERSGGLLDISVTNNKAIAELNKDIAKNKVTGLKASNQNVTKLPDRNNDYYCFD